VRDRPLTSVFMMCKDRVGMIRRAVESVLGQTCPPDQFVIQDGASRDGTLEVLKEYSSRLDLVSERDSSAGAAFWTAFRRCRGDFIGSCLSDERLLPDALEVGTRFLSAHPGTGAITRDTVLVDGLGVQVAEHVSQAFTIQDFLLHKVTPHFVSVLFRREAIEQCGLHDIEWDVDCGEFELFCRLMLTWSVDYLPGPAAEYMLHAPQLSRQPANVVLMAEARARVVDRLLEERHQELGGPDRYRDVVVANTLQFAKHLRFLGALPQAIQLYAWAASLPVGRKRANERVPQAFTPMAEAAAPGGDDREAVLSACAGADSEAACALSRAWTAQGHTQIAIDLLTRRAAADATDAEARWELGLLLEARGLVDEALDVWRHEGVLADYGRHAHVLNASLKAPSSSHESLLDAHRDWTSRHPLRPVLPVWRRPPARRHRRIRVAYLCAFWQTPTAEAQILPVLRHHDRGLVEVVAYGDRLDESLIGAVDVFHLLAGLSDAEFTLRVRADNIDVLVETSGFSPGHRFGALAQRCAPVQVSYLNYPGTTGIPNVDYVIGDEVAVPGGFTEVDGTSPFTERIVRLPRCFFAFDYGTLSAPPVEPAPCERLGHVTYGCFATGSKISEPLVRRWAEILHRLPTARLLLQNNDLTAVDNRRNLAQRFGRIGVGPEQLILRPGASRQRLLEGYSQVDIALDTFPYNGGNTTAEALWQGVPVVGFRGDRFAAAYGASLIAAGGCPELVAATEDEYVDLAVTLGADYSRLRRYRSSLRDRCHAGGLADGAALARALEDAYVGMVEAQ
jgi:hypothetical protein